MNLKNTKKEPCLTRKEEPFQNPTYPPSSLNLSQPTLVTLYFEFRERHLWYFLLCVSISFSLPILECYWGHRTLGLKVVFKEDRANLCLQILQGTHKWTEELLHTEIFYLRPHKKVWDAFSSCKPGWYKLSVLHFPKLFNNSCFSLCFTVEPMGCRTSRVQ